MFSGEFKVALVKEIFKDGSGSMSDAVFEVIGEVFDDIALKSIFMELPEGVQIEALLWGLSDTVFGDNVCEYLREKVKANG